MPIDLNKIICGDSLAELKKLPDNFINCCVTSPPYWGLRDYGTAQWAGGRANCSHFKEDKGKNAITGQKNDVGGIGNAIYKDICGKCGAVRIDNQIGLEKKPDEYVNKIVSIFCEARRVLRDDGTLWLNLGDSYANDSKWGGSSGGKHVAALHGQTGIGRQKVTTGLKPKDLVGIPWRIALALQADGWYLRSDIIWHKPNPMPESVTDRPTKSHEYIFLLSKNQKYYYDADIIREKFADNRMGNPGKSKSGDNFNRNDGGIANNGRGWEKGKELGGRNKRSVWKVPTRPFPGAHFAVFPPDLIEPCILAGCPKGGIVFDPFMGAGTTAIVSLQHDRKYIGIELNPEYIKIIDNRIEQEKKRIEEKRIKELQEPLDLFNADRF